MKKQVIATALTTVMAASFSAQAKLNNNIAYAGDMEFAGFCKAAVTDNVDLFKRTLNKNAIKLTGSSHGALDYVLDGNKVSCNGQSIAEFAAARNAEKLVNFLSNEEADVVETRVTFVGDKRFAGFCKAAINDSVDLFNRALRRQVGYIAGTREEALSIVVDGTKVSCGGKSIEEFSKERGAEKLVAFLNNASA